MKLKRVKLRSVVGVLLFTISTIALADWNPRPGWKDSYAVGGVCYCDSTNYDHNLSSKSADTPIGPKNVVQICNDIRRKLGTGSTKGRIPYNDIQCGHGPANDAADEKGCPGRVDIGSKGCDVKGPRWDLQAVYGVAQKPALKSVVKPAPKPPQASVQSASSGSCAIVTQRGMSLIEAKQQFVAACPGLRRRDCDPVSGSRWMCSTDNITSNSVVKPTSPQPNSKPAKPVPLKPVAAKPVPLKPIAFKPVQSSVPTGRVCKARGPNLGAARLAYATSCPSIPRIDCDPSGNKQWTCSSAVIGNAAPGKPASGGTATPVPTSTSTVAKPETPKPAVAVSNPTSAGSIGKVGANDLVALHYDNCPDRDDGHALAAGKAVVVRSGLQKVLVVNGTCGDSIRNSYQRGSENVVRAVWGNQWLDSFNDLNASIQTSAQRWAGVLANGGNVWVAEGGPSDFTARVLRRIASQFPTLNLKKVHVVQHAAGTQFNEAQSIPSNIAFIKREADYVAIPNGNVGGNGSANFKKLSSFFVSTARQSEFSNEWNAAFNYLSPNRRLDFSDTVELLYLIGDKSTQSVDDFARKYLR
ncbi:MAG: hypothetical protein V3U65_17610 [Granulosicoccaceae bacterium]